MIKADFNRELDDILKKLPEDDMAIFVMADGRARGAVFGGTRFVNTARAQHNLGILETMLFGQASLCGALLLPTMKSREHITWRYEVSGVAQGFSVEADSSGYVRGYLFNDHIPVQKPLEDWDLAPFLGEGTMSVSSIHVGDKAPYTSSIEVSGQSIAGDLAHYFLQSEQIQTAFNTSIQMDKAGRVIGAGGLFVQVMPEVGGKTNSGSAKDSASAEKENEAIILNIEEKIKKAPSLGRWFSEAKTTDALVYELFKDFAPAIALHRSVVFDCPCSKETYLRHIRALPQSEIADIKQNGPDPLEIICRNCSSVYHIPVKEI